MELYEAIRGRKSVREYLDRPVDDALLGRIMEAARLAPSARNGQEWRFVAVRDPATRRRIAEEAARQPFIGSAAVILACCAETDGRVMRGGQAAYPIDVAIAMDHLSLAATAEGLGTCWIGSYDEAMVKSILGIPEAVRVVELMSLGWPSDPAPVAKSRHPMAAILMEERWRSSEQPRG
jgi:nitroreductase